MFDDRFQNAYYNEDPGYINISKINIINAVQVYAEINIFDWFAKKNFLDSIKIFDEKVVFVCFIFHFKGFFSSEERKKNAT